MDAYDQEFLDSVVEDTRKELCVANVDGSIAAEVISNLDEIRISDLKKSNFNILSRVDKVQTVKPEPEEVEPSLPSLTKIIAPSPDGRVRVRRSKHISKKEKKPYDK